MDSHFLESLILKKNVRKIQHEQEKTRESIQSKDNPQIQPRVAYVSFVIGFFCFAFGFLFLFLFGRFDGTVFGFFGGGSLNLAGVLLELKFRDPALAYRVSLLGWFGVTSVVISQTGVAASPVVIAFDLIPYLAIVSLGKFTYFPFVMSFVALCITFALVCFSLFLLLR
jgi:hypothetical protein